MSRHHFGHNWKTIVMYVVVFFNLISIGALIKTIEKYISLLYSNCMCDYSDSDVETVIHVLLTSHFPLMASGIHKPGFQKFSDQKILVFWKI